MITNKISDYIKEKGISIKRIAEKTGISYQVLYSCFDKNSKRQLKADELISVCTFLEIDLTSLSTNATE